MDSNEQSANVAGRPRPDRAWLRLVAATVILVVVIVLIAVAVGRQEKVGSATSSRVVRVVAGENFWGNIASQIGGDHVKVTSIISDPSADPHLYESDANDAAAVAAAQVVVVNGLGYDDFMNKLLSASPKSGRQVLTVTNVLNVTGSDPNPHLWYDTPKVPVVAEAIESALAAKDPADAATFEANLTRFESSLQPILKVIAQIKSRYPGAPVAYTERVPGYLLADAGLTVKTPPGFASAIEDGNDPSPADTATMESLFTDHRVKVLLYNSQATSSVTQHIRDLATAYNIPIVGVSETLPADQANFQSWQLAQVNALLAALER